MRHYPIAQRLVSTTSYFESSGRIVPAASCEQRLTVPQLVGVLLVDHALQYAVAFDEVPKPAVVPMSLIVPVHSIDDRKNTDPFERHS